MKNTLLLCIIGLCIFTNSHSQCPYSDKYIPQTSGIDYRINGKIDTNLKAFEGHQSLTWTNPSEDTIRELRFYMYMNAFKDTLSTFLKGSGSRMFGNDFSNRNANEWGSIDISNCSVLEEGYKVLGMKYIQPDDANPYDQTILSISLSKGLAPHQSITIEMDFTVKLPKTIVRAGYGRDDYYLFVHWFPQMCVFEKKANNEWGWNSHQFFKQTEFFADFSSFDVTLTAPSNLVLGATGCRESKKSVGNNTIYNFKAFDVIDFAVSAYSRFEVYSDQWNGVDITVLAPPEHCHSVPRYVSAVKHALQYLTDHIGPYPYPAITIVDPPLHTLNSGFMEYPMLITCATFAYVPKGVRTIESLAIHEFAHQYFMGILATNEKEEAWLDEGFVTFYEDEIIDHYFGKKGASLFDIMGFRSANWEQSRLEYTSLSHPNSGVIARPGWEINQDYKPLIYGKTATMLRTLKANMGPDNFDKMMKTYYQKHKFTHPSEISFLNIVGDHTSGFSWNVVSFLKRCLHTIDFIDYRVEKVTQEQGQYEIVIANEGNLELPQDITIQYEDGKAENKSWDGAGRTHIIKGNGRIVSVVVDPEFKTKLDVNRINNSWQRKVNKVWPISMTAKVASWFHFLIQGVL